MLTLAITLVCTLLSWRMLFPPLAVVLFLFLDPSSTAGTAAAVPYSEYTCSMVWGGLLGGTLTSLKQLHANRNNGPLGIFTWRVATVCVLICILIRISVAICGHYYGAGNDTASVGPLTLIIVLAYLWDRRAWWCFISMLVVQLSLSLYIIANPTSTMNGAFIRVETGEQMERTVSNLVNQTDVIGTRYPGQFNNTIPMAIHAAVGVVAGLALLIGTRGQAVGKKLAATAVGTGLIIVGGYLLGISASRGVMIGLAIGILIHFLNARGPKRFAVLGVALAGFAFAGYYMIDLIPEEDPLWGRFVSLRYTGESEDYRIAAMRNGVDAIMGSPVLGWGDFDLALEAGDGYLPHIGPYFLAVLHGIPVGLLASLILVAAGMADLTGKNTKALETAPELRPLCAFATMSCWIALAAIFTNGYTVASFLYILLGIAMWPMISRPSLEDTQLKSAADEDLELPITRDHGEVVRS
jgi:hypothetical protein